MCFNSSTLERCFYCHDSRTSTDCADLTFCENCEICYESVNSQDCYNSDYLQDCKNCVDCRYCYGCVGCNDCFGCAGLIRKRFCIFNKQLGEGEYHEQLSRLKQKTHAEIWAEFEKIMEKVPRVYMHQQDNQDSFGDYLYHSKNCFWCFDSYDCEDSMYVYQASLERGTRDCVDCGPIANDCEQCYDCCWDGFLFDCQHVYWADRIQHCAWCVNMFDSHHCFGCMFVKNKAYMILNEKVSKSEYVEKTAQIGRDLKKRGITDLYGLLYA